ncbi:MAG TPA: sugar kinase [Candidatus Limnocylindrales bacterium]|nr:sugar kinase [Candidatus Limnocylindrales bacterium]
MFDVTTLGEIILRLSTPAGTRLEQARALDFFVGGAEANVASLLARLGHYVGCVTALPATALGRLSASALREAGVDLGGLLWRESGRMGTYYVECSEPPRPTQVIYDREASTAAQLQAGEIPVDYLLDTRLLHLTGITPPLSENLREAVLYLAAQARARSVPLSVDVNYRSRLWPPDQAAAVLDPLMHGAALVFCKAADAQLLFGMQGSPIELARGLAERFGAGAAVVTHGAEGVYAWGDGQSLHEAAVPVHILDRIGAGDAMAAGVLRGWLRDDLAYGLRAGAMLSALALTQYGDAVVTTASELDGLLAAHSGDVQR